MYIVRVEHFGIWWSVPTSAYHDGYISDIACTLYTKYRGDTQETVHDD